MNDFEAVLQAANARNWWLVSSLVIYMLVRLVKVKPEIAAKLPPRIRPWLAVGLGLVAGVLNKIATGTPWSVALIAGAGAGLTAVVGHEFVVESLLNGKEIGVKTPTDSNGSTGGPPAGGAPTVPPTALPRFTLARAFSWQNVKLSLLAGALSVLLVATTNCALFTPKAVSSALDAAQLACVFESQVSDEKSLADACSIANDLIPIVRRLIAQREAAKRSGVAWVSERFMANNVFDRLVISSVPKEV